MSLLVRVLSRRLTTSGNAGSVVEKVTLPTKSHKVLKDRLSNLKLLQNKNQVNIRFDEKDELIVEGEKAAVAAFLPKIQSLQMAERETDFIKAITDLLGSKPVKLPSASWPRRAGAASPINPDNVWIFKGYSEGSLHIWAETSDKAQEIGETLKKWAPVLKDYKENKNFKLETEIHPNFRWLDRDHFNALPLKDVLVTKMQDTVKIWAVDDSAAQAAAKFFSEPYRPANAKDIEFSISMDAGETGNPMLDRVKVFDAVAKALVGEKDDSVKVVEASPVQLRLQTYWPLKVVVDGFKRRLQRTLKEGDAQNKLHMELIQTTNEIASRALDKIKSEVSDNSIAVATGELSPAPHGHSKLVWIVGKHLGPVSASRIYFDPTPNLVHLRIKAFRDITEDVSNALVSRIGRTILGWGDDGAHLRHWGMDVFSAVDDKGVGQQRMQEACDALATTILDGFSPSGHHEGVTLWHMSNKKCMLVAKDQATLDTYLKDIDTKRSKGKASSTTTPLATTDERSSAESASAAGLEGQRILQPVRPVKVTRVSIAAPANWKSPDAAAAAEPTKSGEQTATVAPAEKSDASVEKKQREKKIPVTRITASIPAAAADPKPIKVTRIVAPSFEEIDQQAALDGNTAAVSKTTRENSRRVPKKTTPRGYNVTRTIDVPVNMTGKVIGRHGMVMRGIETRTKTVIELHDPEKGKMAQVTISGATEAHVELAAGEIQTILEDAGEKDKVEHEGGAGLRKSRFARRRRSMEGEGDRAGAYDDEESGERLKLFSPAYRSKIYETYKSDPERWTEEELATQFNISPDHVRAIKLIMKNREAYLEKYKDDPELVSTALEEAMVAKCGETTESERHVEQPLLKSHLRFLSPEAAAAITAHEDAEQRRQRYDAKITPILASKPTKTETVKEQKKANGFLLTIEDTRKVVAVAGGGSN